MLLIFYLQLLKHINLNTFKYIQYNYIYNWYHTFLIDIIQYKQFKFSLLTLPLLDLTRTAFLEVFLYNIFSTVFRRFFISLFLCATVLLFVLVNLTKCKNFSQLFSDVKCFLESHSDWLFIVTLNLLLNGKDVVIFLKQNYTIKIL